MDNTITTPGKESKEDDKPTKNVEASENDLSAEKEMTQLPVSPYDSERESVSNKADSIRATQSRNHAEVLTALLEELGPIDFRKKSGLPEEEKIGRKHYLVIIVDEILKVATSKRWDLCTNQGYVYVFNGAFWKPLSKAELQTLLGKAAKRLGLGKFEAEYYQFKSDLVKQFISAAHLERSVNKGSAVLINLLNGTFVITSGKQYTKDFDPNDFLTYQLPFAYDPTQSASLFKAFLHRVLPDADAQKVLSEYIGYLFVSSRVLKLEKALILYGSGANGKSVFFEIIKALLGNENVSNYSLQSLTDTNGYYRAMIHNKLLNYASEISSRMNNALFKQLVSGEPVEARSPYERPVIIEDYAKLIFNANELPKDVEQIDAYFRRFIILHFAVTIPEEERDPELANKIIASELPGVFNWVLEGLGRLLIHRRFTYSEMVEKMINQYRLESDTVQLFLTEYHYSPSVTNEVTLKELFNEYQTFCNESNERPCSLKVFSDRLRKLDFKTPRKNTGTFVLAEKKVLSDPTPATPSTPDDKSHAG